MSQASDPSSPSPSFTHRVFQRSLAISGTPTDFVLNLFESPFLCVTQTGKISAIVSLPLLLLLLLLLLQSLLLQDF